MHAAGSVFKDILVPSAIKFPSGRELEDVMNGFQGIAQLQMCAGAVDGTFVHIKKQALLGDLLVFKKLYCHSHVSSV